MTSLTAIAVVTGAVLAWIWKRFSNHERIALAKRQMRAQLYAMRLYADDPALIFRAQARLLLWTGRYTVRMLPPVAVAIVPLLVLWLQLDNVYGHRALAPGESAIVTAQFSGSADVSLEGRGVVVETPGVRIPGRQQVCWRVRAGRRLKPTPAGSLILHIGGIAISQKFRCGHAFWERPPRIEVPCPAATLDIFGFSVEWPFWFLGVSGLTMLALRKGGL